MNQTFKVNDAQVFFSETSPRRVFVTVDSKTVGRDWLPEFRGYEPNKQSAKYYYQKHVLKIDNPKLLEKSIPVRRVQPHSVEGFKNWLQENLFVEVGSLGGGLRYVESWGPLEKYIAAMKDQGKWKKTSFQAYGRFQNRPRWMTRLNNFLHSISKDRDYSEKVLGAQVLSLLNEKWDCKDYDCFVYDWYA